MSRSLNTKLKLIQRNYWTNTEMYEKLSYKDKVKIWHWYSQTPSWWNHLFHTRPRRAKERNLLKQLDLQHDRTEQIMWPLDKKPHKYYW